MFQILKKSSKLHSTSSSSSLSSSQQQTNNSKRSPSPTPPLNKKSKSIALPASTRKRKHEEINTTGGSVGGVASATNLKENGNSNESDLTKNMEAPMAQPHVEEVHVPKNVNIKKESSDYLPYRNGTLIDLDEDKNHIFLFSSKTRNLVSDHANNKGLRELHTK